MRIFFLGENDAKLPGCWAVPNDAQSEDGENKTSLRLKNKLKSDKNDITVIMIAASNTFNLNTAQ